VDFPHFSRHASITPQQEKSDAEDDHGEEDPIWENRDRSI